MYSRYKSFLYLINVKNESMCFMSNLKECFFEAARTGDVKELSNLLPKLKENSMGVDVENKNKDTALCLTSAYGKAVAGKWLINNGANKDHVNAYEMTPSMLATWELDIDTVQMLHGKGADFRIANAQGETPLDLAEVKATNKVSSFGSTIERSQLLAKQNELFNKRGSKTLKDIKEEALATKAAGEKRAEKEQESLKEGEFTTIEVEKAKKIITFLKGAGL